MYDCWLYLMHLKLTLFFFKGKLKILDVTAWLADMYWLVHIKVCQILMMCWHMPGFKKKDILVIVLADTSVCMSACPTVCLPVCLSACMTVCVHLLLVMVVDVVVVAATSAHAAVGVMSLWRKLDVYIWHNFYCTDIFPDCKYVLNARRSLNRKMKDIPTSRTDHSVLEEYNSQNWIRKSLVLGFFVWFTSVQVSYYAFIPRKE